MRIKFGLRFLAMTIAMTVMTAAFSIQAFAAGALASVNGTEYNTLEEVMYAVNQEGSKPVTIKFLQGFELPMALQILENQDITLDLNGQTITANLDRFMIRNNGKLTITGDGTAYNTCATQQGCGVIYNDAAGDLTIESGTFGSSQTRGNAIRNLGEANLNGGTYTACDNYINGGYAYAIANSTGTMTLGKDVIVSGNMNGAIAADGGELIVNGGTYTLGDGENNSLYCLVYTSKAGNVKINGGTFTRNVPNDYGFMNSETGSTGSIYIEDGTFEDIYNNHITFSIVADVHISGGTFSGDIEKAETASLSITGGKFPEADVSEYIGENYKQDKDGNVVIDESKTVKIGSVYYPTLAAAVDAVQQGETIELTGNLTGSGVKVVSGSNFTIDFGGFTYTVVDPTVGSSGTETNGFQLLRDSNLTFKNGTIKAGNSKVLTLIQNYSNLTLEDITLDGTLSIHVLGCNNGASKITGNTNIIPGTDGQAFDVYYWPSSNYKSVSVTIDENMTGKITGTIAYDHDGTAEDSVVKENAKIAISAGTFTEPVAPEFCAPGFVPAQNENGEYIVEKVSTVLSDAGADAIVTDGKGTLRFITKLESLGGTPTSFGTYMLPLDLFDSAWDTHVEVKYTDDIKAGDTFAADLTDIPPERIDTIIYARSFIFIDGVENPVTVELKPSSVELAAE